MYRIIGADQKEYGPVAAEQLRQWIREGRANAETQAQVEGAAEWKPLGSISEFADVLPKALVFPPPIVPPPVKSPAGAARTNGMAVAGFVLSILGFIQCCGPFFSTLGLIFSAIGLVQIDKNPEQESGRGLAIAGMVIAVLGFILFALWVATGLLRGFIHEFRI